jgi:hypothetical protein
MSNYSCKVWHITCMTCIESKTCTRCISGLQLVNNDGIPCNIRQCKVCYNNTCQ